MGSSTCGKCAVCGKDSTLRCSGCHQAFYCSASHQKSDWKTHKKTCHPFKVCTNEKLGRYYVSSRDIKAGEIVLKESPLVVGPSQETGPVCIGCLEGLDENNHLNCDKCGWPTCEDEKCRMNSNHQGECQLTIARGERVTIRDFIAPHPTYKCLMPLRCLLLKEKNPAKFDKLLELQSNVASIENTEKNKSNLEDVPKFIQRFFKTKKWSEKEIMKIVGIVQTNAHEIPLTRPSCVAIYHQASLIAHSCTPNLSKSFTNKGEIILWAPKPIKADEHLTISYTDVLWGTSNRRYFLKETKKFDCDCARCSDMTEFGTHFSSLRCPKCKEGFVLPKNLQEYEKDWSCNKCSKTITNELVTMTLNHTGQDLQAMEKENEENCIKFIDHYSKFLAPNHFYLTDVKIALVQIIGGGQVNKIQTISDDLLNMKARYCSEILALIEKIAPCESRIIGLIKFELHSSYAEIGRRSLAVKDQNCRGILEESLIQCLQAVNLLMHEPSILPEAEICKQARINADSLKMLLGGMADAGI